MMSVPGVAPDARPLAVSSLSPVRPDRGVFAGAGAELDDVEAILRLVSRT